MRFRRRLFGWKVLFTVTSRASVRLVRLYPALCGIPLNSKDATPYSNCARASRRTGRRPTRSRCPLATPSRLSAASGRRAFDQVLAERVGFEPTDRLHGQRFSRPPRSTTPAPLLMGPTLEVTPFETLAPRHPSPEPRYLRPLQRSLAMAGGRSQRQTSLHSGGEGGIRVAPRLEANRALGDLTPALGHQGSNPSSRARPPRPRALTTPNKSTFWRRGRDSNPRLSFPNTRFPGVHLRPLGHLSVTSRCARAGPGSHRPSPTAAKTSKEIAQKRA